MQPLDSTTTVLLSIYSLSHFQEIFFEDPVKWRSFFDYLLMFSFFSQVKYNLRLKERYVTFINNVNCSQFVLGLDWGEFWLMDSLNQWHLAGRRIYYSLSIVSFAVSYLLLTCIASTIFLWDFVIIFYCRDT